LSPQRRWPSIAKRGSSFFAFLNALYTLHLALRERGAIKMSSKSLRTPDRIFLEEKLAKLKRTWERSRLHGRGRFGFYRYLEKVYAWYAKLRTKKGLANKVRDKIANMNKLSKRTQSCHAMYVMIVVTSGETKRTQSRWTQALRYAWKYRERHQLGLKEFFQANGGPAGCATRLKSGIKPNIK
jgi:hypothetical protein